MAELDDVVNAINNLRASLEKERVGTTAKTAEELELENKMLQERADLLKAEIAAEEDLAKKQQLKNERLSIYAEIVKRSNRDTETKAKILKSIERQQKKNTKATEKATEAEKEQAEAVESVVENLTGFLGVSRSVEKSLISQTKKVLSNAESYEKLQDELKETLKVGNLAYSGLAKSLQTTILLAGKSFAEYEEGITSFNRITGMTDMFGASITEAAVQFRQFGVTSGDVSQSLAILGQAFPLNELGESAASVASQFALYEKFGVSAQASSAAFTDLTRSLGRSNEEALRSISNIGELGRQLGVGAGALVEDFAQALPRLAIYGNQAEKIFRNVATTSAKLGLSTADIIDLAEGFQTFESSAQAAGQLNAILGGGFIDNLELMEAAFENPAEAAMMIKDAFASAGASLDTMGPAAIKAAATAAGFGDVNKFRRFIEGEISATEALGDDQKDLQLSANDIAKESQGILQSILDSLQGGFNGLVNKAFPVMTEAVKGVIGALGPGGTLAVALLGLPAALSLVGPAARGALGLGARLLGGAAGGGAAATGAGAAGGIAGAATRLGGIARFGGGALGIAGAAGMVGKDAIDLLRGETTGENIGGVTGGAAGAILGGVIGSVVPVVGTAIGASVGAGLGNLLGESVGKSFDSSMPAKKQVQTATQATQQQSIEHKHVIEIIQDTNNAERFVKAVYRKDLSS